MDVFLRKGGMVKMIPVIPQPEPAGFDRDVRQKGHEWLKKNGIDLNSAPQNPSKLPTLWRKYNEKLWDSYSGVCAYLAFYFEFASGAVNTDHFIAKSKDAGNAYEWDNYRLACLSANQRKNKYDDVLDPFTIPQDVFFLCLVTGKIYVSPLLKKQNEMLAKQAEKTIMRLKLDNQTNRKMRVRHIDEYYATKKHSSDAAVELLLKHNPFVYHEMKRQKKL